MAVVRTGLVCFSVASLALGIYLEIPPRAPLSNKVNELAQANRVLDGSLLNFPSKTPVPTRSILVMTDCLPCLTDRVCINKLANTPPDELIVCGYEDFARQLRNTVPLHLRKQIISNEEYAVLSTSHYEAAASMLLHVDENGKVMQVTFK